MDNLVENDPNFTYTSVTAPNGNVIVDTLGVYQPSTFNGRTGIRYLPGVYRLAQSFTSPTPNPYSVWQYYLFDANGNRVSVMADTSFTNQTVEDGWSIVWRLVTICNGPVFAATRLRSTLPDAAQKDLGMI